MTSDDLPEESQDEVTTQPPVTPSGESLGKVEVDEITGEPIIKQEPAGFFASTQRLVSGWFGGSDDPQPTEPEVCRFLIIRSNIALAKKSYLFTYILLHSRLLRKKYLSLMTTLLNWIWIHPTLQTKCVVKSFHRNRLLRRKWMNPKCVTGLLLLESSSE